MLTDDEIVRVVFSEIQEEEEIDDEGEEENEKSSHDEGRKVLQLAPSYIEHKKNRQWLMRCL